MDLIWSSGIWRSFSSLLIFSEKSLRLCAYSLFCLGVAKQPGDLVVVDVEGLLAGTSKFAATNVCLYIVDD